MTDVPAGTMARGQPGLATIGHPRSIIVWFVGGLLVAATTCLFVTLAYSQRPTLRLAIGDETNDKGVVHGFYDDERREGDGLRFRWTRGSAAIALPAWGAGAYRLVLDMAAPLNPDPSVTVLVNDEPIAVVAIGRDFERYEFALPESLLDRGDITIGIDSPTFSPPADRRKLGVVVHAVELTPEHGGWRVPPPLALTSALGLGLLFYMALGLAGWQWRGAALGAIGMAATLAAILTMNRLLVVPILHELIGVGLVVVVAIAVLRLMIAGLSVWPGWRIAEHERRWLLTIVGTAIVVRLASTFHPQMDIIDLGFHVNRFTDVAERGMLFLKIRSAEWGGRETVYSPAAYIAMLPLNWLVDDKHRMIRLFTVLMESSRALLVFALARWVSQRGPAALLATLLFVSLPLAVLPFSWGITSNLFGEWWATLLILVLTVGWADLARPRVLASAIAVATLALLSHPGDLLLSGAFLALLSSWLLINYVRRPNDARASERRRTLAAVTIMLVAGCLAFALFYRVDAVTMVTQASTTIGARVSDSASTEVQRRWRVSGSVDDKSLGMGARYVTDIRDVPLSGARGFLQEAWAYYWIWPLPAAIVGWVILGGSERGRVFRQVAGTLAVVAALFAIVGLVLNLYVRYMLFLMPVVCTLAGVALDRLNQRGRWGLVATGSLLAATVISGVWLWHQRVVFFFH